MILGRIPMRETAVLSPLPHGFLPIWAVSASAATPYTLVAFGGYMVGVFLLGALSHQLLQRGSFLKEYFLGDRQLNAWVLGLTYVATSVSAGSFVGFPSLIYRNGWIMALWIAGYMVDGLVSKGALAKRLNQVSRCPAQSPCPTSFAIGFRVRSWACWPACSCCSFSSSTSSASSKPAAISCARRAAVSMIRPLTGPPGKRRCIR